MQIVVDGSGVIEGPLPVIFYALTDSSGRFYPLNGGSEHNTLFGLYDSGATSLFINGLKPRIVERSDGQRELLNGNRVGGVNWEDSDAGHLNVSTGERVNIRLTGVQTQQGNRNPPVRTPGSPDGAQVEVSNLIVKKEDGLNVTLVGAPVINQLVAHLDYTNLADSSWLTYVNQSFHVGVDTPSIDLFWPGDPGIPASDLTLPLEQFGVVTSRSEKRFQLPNVDFTNGRRTVTNWAGDYRYLFDTGSTMTIVSDLIAGELGLAQMTSDFDCLGGRDNGFFIDSVTMYGIGQVSRCTASAVHIRLTMPASVGIKTR